MCQGHAAIPLHRQDFNKLSQILQSRDLIIKLESLLFGATTIMIRGNKRSLHLSKNTS